VSNALDQSGGAEAFGNIDLSAALEHSVNAVFCQIGQRLGAAKILDYAKRFGFYSSPPLETPSGTIYPSGLYPYPKRAGPSLCSPSDPPRQVDAGRLAFGQEHMLVTPLQMALVAATIGNHGREARPYLVQKITAPNGSIVSRTAPSTLARPISARTAAQL